MLEHHFYVEALRVNDSVRSEDELDVEYIIPSVFNRDVAPAVAAAVALAAVESGVARRSEPPAG